MTATVSIRGAKCVDFTRSADGFKQFPSFGDPVISLVRDGLGPRLLVVVDRGYFLEDTKPYVVRDHLNLTGSNPLVGPNDPCGERFPSVNNIYITDLCPELPRGIAAGMKWGVFPTRAEMEFIRSLGADFCCYNLVPTMIVAAHAGYRVLALAVPEGVDVKPVLKPLFKE